MAEQQNTTTPDEPELLDLRALARSSFPVLTSAGRLEMRRVSALGPVDRTRVIVQQQELARRADAFDAHEPLADGLATLAEQLVAQEDELLRIAVPTITDEQLAQLDAPERAGLLSAFFGATPAEARRVVAGVVTYMEGRPRGTKRSRASKGSTAATPSAG